MAHIGLKEPRGDGNNRQVYQIMSVEEEEEGGKERKEKWSHFKTKISVYLGIKQLGNIGHYFFYVCVKQAI